MVFPCHDLTSELNMDRGTTPAIVLLRDGKKLARYTGYNGEKKRFWDWLGYGTLARA